MNDVQIIQQKIHEIRGQRVILDFDLAELYQVTTGNLNKAVKRNNRRFPPDFMFQLTKDEFDELKNNLIFQFGISRWGGTRKLPHAFTEQGVAMLSGILNSTIAIDMNIAIMRAFVAIRRMATSLPPANAVTDIAQLRQDFEELKLDIEDILANQNDINEDTRAQLELINQSLAALQTTHRPPRRPILGFRMNENE